MSDITTLTGIVATVPKHFITTAGVAVTSFRLASGQRRFDRAKNAWVDADTNWYSVSTFRHLAFNVAQSVCKGEHIVVTGRLRVRDWTNEDRKGTSIEIEADALGHDLLWCTTSAVRSAPSAAAAAARVAEREQPEQSERDLGEPSETGESGAFPATDPYAVPTSREASDGFLPVEPPAFATQE
jgi:single-strand DNA-binding protein